MTIGTRQVNGNCSLFILSARKGVGPKPLWLNNKDDSLAKENCILRNQLWASGGNNSSNLVDAPSFYRAIDYTDITDNNNNLYISGT